MQGRYNTNLFFSLATDATDDSLLYDCCRIIVITVVVKGQDLHYAEVQDMNLWYNPALKINKNALAHVSVRSVNYPTIISYKSKAITFELPFVGSEKSDYDNIPFVNLTAGIHTDNSSDGFFKASTAMLSLSYALPLNEDNTYLAIGFQGNYSFNQVGADVIYTFPDRFDKYGALNSALITDPYESGFNYGYFTAAVGAAFFHSGEQKQWYMGGSVRQFNHPYTEWTYSARLPSNYGIQAGYESAINHLNHLSSYVNLTWQANINEQFIGARYTRYLTDSANTALLLGACYRFGNAMVPNIGVQVGASRAMFYYEINIPENYHRKTFEFSYQLTL